MLQDITNEEAIDFNAEEDTLNLTPEFFEAPTAGESLTTDPDNPKAYERPPQFNDPKEATHKIFMMLTEEGNYEEIIDALNGGLPIDILTQVYLFQGFREGYWSVDLMLSLAEPTMYILIWIADEAGIEAVLDSDGDDWDDEQDNTVRKRMQEDIVKSKPQANQLPPSLLAKMDEFTPRKEQGEV